MTSLTKLLNLHCQEGVPFVALEELADTFTGLSGKTKADFAKGNSAYVSYMNIFVNPCVDFDALESVNVPEGEKQNSVTYGDVLFTGSSEAAAEVGMSSVVTTQYPGKVYLNSFSFGLRFRDSNLFLPEFTKHLFRSHKVREQIVRSASGVTRYNMSKAKFLKTLIPVPPIEAQREIARILDNFTALEAELEAELEARQIQFAFYRSEVFEFAGESEVSWLSLSELAEIGTGSRNTNQAVVDGDYPFYVRSQTVLNAHHYDFDEEAVITAGDGVGVGKVLHYVSGQYALHQRAYRIRPFASKLNTKYLYHFMKHDFGRYIKSVSVHASVTSLRKPMFDKYLIPVPSLDKQREIVEFLDAFLGLTENPRSGLNAELEARKRQYGYYRDQLLTFEEA